MSNVALAQPGHLRPGQSGQRRAQRRLVALDGEQVVGSAVVQIVRVRALAVQGIGGDHEVAQVRHGVQDGGERGQLVSAAHFGLGQRQALGVIEDRDQLGLSTVAVAGAAQSLAVDGQHRTDLTARPNMLGALSLPGLAAGQDPAGQRPLQRGGIDRGQHPAERGRMRRRPADAHRLLGVRGPLGDRRVRAGAGQHGTDREQQNRLQTVTTPPRLARVRNRRQGLEQADRLGRTQRLGR